MGNEDIKERCFLSQQSVLLWISISPSDERMNVSMCLWTANGNHYARISHRAD